MNKKKLAIAMLACVMCMSAGATAAACSNKPDTPPTGQEQTEPEKVKDGEAFGLEVGGQPRYITVRDYITLNGNTPTCSSSDDGKVAVSYEGGVATVTPVAEGGATVTISCGSITVTFEVTVGASSVVKYTVTVDGTVAATVDAGSQYELPAAVQPEDTNFEFVAWTVGGKDKQPGDKIVVTENVEITAKTQRKAPAKVKDGGDIEFEAGSHGITVSEYITTYGNEVTATSSETEITAVYADGVVTLTATEACTGTVTVICGSVEVTFNVKVSALSDDRCIITIDGEYVTTVDKGSEYELPAAVQPEDTNFEFVAWTVGGEDKQPGDKIVVTENVVITAKTQRKTPVKVKDGGDVTFAINGSHTITVADYVTTYGNEVTATSSETKLTAAYAEGVVTLTATEACTGTVTVTCGSVAVTFNVTAEDTSIYHIQNGDFNNTEGWTGATGSIGTADTYFEANHPMNNDGSYYVGIDAGTETLTSAPFTVGGTGWITFKLGSMRPYETDAQTEITTLRDIYLEVVQKGDSEDTVVARVRNVLFSDPTAALKLNDYKLQLPASLKGKQVYLRAVDNEDGGDFRNLYLDKIVTYYSEAPSGDYTDLTEIRYLSGTALNIDLNGETATGTVNAVLSEGVICDHSYDGVKVYSDDTESDGLAVAGLFVTAKKSGVYRVVYNEGTDSEFTVNVTVTNSTVLPEFEDKTAEINVDESISSIPLELKSANERFDYILTVDKGTVDESGNFTYNDANTSQSGVINVTVTVKIRDTKCPDEVYEDKSYNIIITVKGKNISLNETKELAETYDLNDKAEGEQSSRTIDFAEYLIIPDGKTVTYTGTLTVDEGAATAITFTDSAYTLNYADHGLGETTKALKFAVTASAGSDTPVTINLTLNVKDTRAYRVKNGDFETGDLTGWTLSNSDLGGVNNAETYWSENIPFNNDGNFFNAYFFNGEARENAMGTLTSSPFVIGGSGWITYKLGGAKNADKVYLDVIEKDTGNILARYYNNAFSDDGVSTEVRGCTLVAYRADLSEHKGKTVYIRLSDNAVKDYGLFFADSFVTYNPDVPTEGNEALSVAHPDTVYQLYNGGFETGDLSGWTMTQTELDGEMGDIGYVSSQDVYWGNNDKPYDKDGTYLFSGVEDVSGSFEKYTGTLTSSYFTVGGCGWISFKLGGGGNEQCYISIIDESGNELLRFHQQNLQEGKLIVHKADLSSLMGRNVAIRVVDNAKGDWGCVAVDSFITYYETEAELPNGDDVKTAPNLLASTPAE